MRAVIVATGVIALGLWGSETAHAELRVRDICRIKGQEENVLHGMGLVVGLKEQEKAIRRPNERWLVPWNS